MLHSTPSEHTSFSWAPKTFSRTDHVKPQAEFQQVLENPNYIMYLSGKWNKITNQN